MGHWYAIYQAGPTCEAEWQYCQIGRSSLLDLVVEEFELSDEDFEMLERTGLVHHNGYEIRVRYCKCEEPWIHDGSDSEEWEL